MRADWCITGGHLANSGAPFSTVLFDIANFHEWSGFSYTSQSFPTRSENGVTRTFTLGLPKTDVLPLKGKSGTYKIYPDAKSDAPSTHGFRVTTKTRVKFELKRGDSLDNLVTKYARPLTTLMTILAGAESSLRGIELISEGGRTLRAYGNAVNAEAQESVGEPFLTRRDVEADLLAEWLDIAPPLSPVPEILASLWSQEIPYIETRTLTLATTAEALHRLLHPEARRFTPEQIDSSISGLVNASMPGPVKASIESALRSHWAKSSYPQRLKDLAAPVADAVPTCIGKLNKWKRAISNLRIRFAHGHSNQPINYDLRQVDALSKSLLWALSFRLLLHSGVTPGELHQAAERSERYKHDARRWKQELPEIFVSN